MTRETVGPTCPSEPHYITQTCLWSQRHLDQRVEQAATVSRHSRRHSPCWSRRWQMSWTLGWTAGRWLAQCASRLTVPPSFRSLRSTRGSFRPLSLASKERRDNAVTMLSRWSSRRETTCSCLFRTSSQLAFICYSAKSKWNENLSLPIMTNWESGVNDASSVTPLLLL